MESAEMFKQSDIIGTDVLDHLGLVAATISQLEIVEKIDDLMPMTRGAKNLSDTNCKLQSKMRFSYPLQISGSETNLE